MKIRLEISLILCLVILFACARPIPSPTVATPSMSHVFRPSAPNTPEYTPTATAIAAYSAFPPAILASVETALDGCWANRLAPDLKPRISPNGEWVASGCGDSDPRYDSFGQNHRIQVARFDGQRDWKYSFKQLTGEDPCAFAPGYQPGYGCYLNMLWKVPYWSPDSRYVLFAIDLRSDRTYMLPDCFHGLYRVDVLTGSISPWLPFTGSCYYFAISPDGKYFVYAAATDYFRIHVNNIETGENAELRFPGEPYKISRFAWSPDSSRMALFAFYSRSGKITATLFLLSVPGPNLDAVFTDQSRLWLPLDWDSDTSLILWSWGECDRYDLESASMKPISCP
jgi:hypothetical protein